MSDWLDRWQIAYDNLNPYEPPYFYPEEGNVEYDTRVCDCGNVFAGPECLDCGSVLVDSEEG